MTRLCRERGCGAAALPHYPYCRDHRDAVVYAHFGIEDRRIRPRPEPWGRYEPPPAA